MSGRGMRSGAEHSSRTFVAKLDDRLQKTPLWRSVRRRGAGPNWIQCRGGPTVLSNQLYFNITKETKFPVSFHHSASRWACRLFSAEAPCIPITSLLGPRCVKVVSIPCRIHLLYRTLTDCILLSLKLFDKAKKVKRRGEAEKAKAIKRIGRYQEVELDRKLGKRELLGAMRLVNYFSAWEKAQDFFCLAFGSIYCHV